jgi:hypothetical protein
MSKIDSPMHCEGCKHILTNSDKQIGCRVVDLKALNAELLEDDLFYTLSKVCLYKNKSVKEVDIKLGYVFILKDLSKLDTLKSNILSIIDKYPLWVGVSIVMEDINKFAVIRDELAQIIEGVCKYNIVVNQEDYSDYYKLDQFMDYYLNGWTYINEAGEFFREDAKYMLTNFILDKGGKAAFISSEKEQINDTCFYNFIYKCLNGNKTEFDENTKKFYYKNFYDKVYEKDQKMILEWSNL